MGNIPLQGNMVACLRHLVKQLRPECSSIFQGALPAARPEKKKRMIICLTNDDGIQSPGLRALYHALADAEACAEIALKIL